MSTEVSRVLVTGASGYISCHVVQQLLQAGHQVRGTVRSLQDEAKVKSIQALVPEAVDRLELVEANLLDESCWDDVVADCSHVLHIASPFPPTQPKNEDDCIQPAVDGTLSVLKACAKNGGVKRVVLTSSAFAICGGMRGGNFTEKDWADPTQNYVTPYSKSKILAERAAWDFMEKSSEGKFELVVLNPVLVLGPTLCANLTTSAGIVKTVLKKEMPSLPRSTVPIVDVRDVATAHVRAMTAEGVAGLRITLHAGPMWIRDLAEVCHQEFGPQGYNVVRSEAWDCTIKFFAFFDKSLKSISCGLGKVNEFDNSRMKSLLDITPMDMKTSVIDTCYSLIEKGFVEKTADYKGKSS